MLKTLNISVLLLLLTTLQFGCFSGKSNGPPPPPPPPYLVPTTAPYGFATLRLTRNFGYYEVFILGIDGAEPDSRTAPGPDIRVAAGIRTLDLKFISDSGHNYVKYTTVRIRLLMKPDSVHRAATHQYPSKIPIIGGGEIHLKIINETEKTQTFYTGPDAGKTFSSTQPIK